MQIFNNTKIPLLLAFFSIMTFSGYSQIPSTDIYLLDIIVKKNKIKISNPVKVTDNPGYDNQPYFTEDGKYLYYTAITDDKQADIYRLDLITLKTQQVTNTAESEYSPTPILGSTAITTVRVDMDSTQRLYELFPFSRKPPEILFPSVKDIGYHCWLNENFVAMFRLEETFNLHLANKVNKRIVKVKTNIGRCFQRVPGTNNLSFVSKSDSLNWTIKQYNLRSKTITDIAPVYNQNEDFVWIGPNLLLMGDKGTFYCYNIEKMKWVKGKNFSSVLGNFYRIQVNSDLTRMAVVTYAGEKP